MLAVNVIGPFLCAAGGAPNVDPDTAAQAARDRQHPCRPPLGWGAPVSTSTMRLPRGRQCRASRHHRHGDPRQWRAAWIEPLNSSTPSRCAVLGTPGEASPKRSVLAVLVSGLLRQHGRDPRRDAVAADRNDSSLLQIEVGPERLSWTFLGELSSLRTFLALPASWAGSVKCNPSQSPSEGHGTTKIVMIPKH